jgi:PAS domain S-box-containing protein
LYNNDINKLHRLKLSSKYILERKMPTIKVLLIDDEPDLLDMSKKFLELDKSMSVGAATSADDALEKLKHQDYDVIISDYQMPGKDGIQLLKEIRGMGNKIPFILFTGRGREEVAIEAFENGADHYLQKGGDVEAQFSELRHRINQSIDLQRAEKEVDAVNHLYAVLCESNRAIVRFQNKTELLNAICMINVVHGRLAMVWAGSVDLEKKTIEPTVWFGYIDGYLETAAISTEDVPRGRGVIGTAFRERRIVVSNDIQNDPAMEPWHIEALRRGYHSIAAFPFALNSKDAGVITLYSSEVGFFTDKVIELLEEQADDITLALNKLEIEEQRRSTMNDLEESELRYRSLFDSAQDGILIIDFESEKIIDANRFISDITGYLPSELIGKELWEIGFIKDRELAAQAFSQLDNVGYVRYEDIPLKKKNGETIPVEFISNVYLVGGGKVVQCNIRDISERQRNEIKIKELAMIIDSTDDAVIGKDLNGIIISWNKGAEKIYGYSRDEILGKSISILAPPDSKEEIESILNKVVQGTTIAHHETTRITKDGRKIYVSLTISPVRDDSGRIVGASTIAYDVTEQKRNEALLKNNEWKFRTASNYNFDWEYWTGPDSRLIFCSPSCERISGYSAEELANNPALLVEMVYLEDRTLFNKHFIRDGRADSVELEFRIVTRGGEIRWIAHNCQAVFDEKGEWQGRRVCNRNITKFKLTLEALRESEERLREVITKTPAGYFFIDNDGRYRTVNAAWLRMHGYESAEEVIGQHYSLTQPDTGIEYADNVVTNVLGGGEVDSGEAARKCKDGSIGFHAFVTHPVRMRGNIIGLEGFLVDNTKQKMTMQALDRAVAAMENSIDGMAILDVDGRYVFLNKAHEEIYGYDSPEELLGKSWQILYDEKELDEFNRRYMPDLLKNGYWCGESVGLRKDGSKFVQYVSLTKLKDGGLICVVRDTSAAVENLVKHRATQYENERTIEFLRLCTEYRSTDCVIRGAISYFQEQSGCEAVGIRLSRGEDYPYYETAGFPNEHVLLENKLCDYENDGQPIRDAIGIPILECMCGNVIRGHFDPTKPFFTRWGSFWTNSSTELLADTTEEDRLARTRNRCNGKGYESVALIPIQSGDVTFGLIQMNDRRKDMFSIGNIERWERLAAYLAIALERFSSQDDFEESHKRYKELFSAYNEGVALHEMMFDDESNPVDYRILEVNPSFEKILGIPKEKAVGRPATEVYMTAQAPYLEKYSRVACTGEPTSFETFFPPLGKHFSISVFSPAKGQFATVFMDITERMRVEEALRESEKKYLDILNNANDAIFVHEFTENGDMGRFIEINDVACQMLGYTREEMFQMRPSDISTNHHEPSLDNVLEDLRVLGKARFESEHRRKDGSILPVEINDHVVELQGRMVAIAVVRDISERKRLEEALRKTNAKLGIMNSITRHDMLNQLTVLNGFIDLGREKEKDPKLVAYLNKMNQAATNLKEQIDFSKDYQEIGVKAPGWVSVSRQTTEAFAMLHPQRITMEITTGDVEVLADHLAEKVPYNLIDNSVRHGKHVTRIKMSAEQKGDAMMIVYQDDGKGISPADREHLFQKGFGKNTGLGLFLIREILAITGITIEEKGQFGKGVRFEMLVPAGGWRRSSS